MKFNLKNRPDKTIFDAEDQITVKVYELWFEGFEKELRAMRSKYKKHGIGDPIVDMLFKEVLGE